MQLFVRGVGPCRSQVYDVSPDDALVALKQRICVRERMAPASQETSIPELVTSASWYLSDARGRNLECYGATLQESGVIDQQTLHIRPRMLGGKGGFGTELRMQSKKRGPKPVTNFGACRDLNGRRLRHVNDAILLQKWNESQKAGGKLSEEKTQIENWYLGTPSWADVRSKQPRQSLLEGKRKTQLCEDWLGGECPRGPSCKFAHGEAELRGNSLIQVQQERQRQKKQQQREERDSYVESVSENYYQDDALAAMVRRGLEVKAQKRRRTGKHEEDDEERGNEGKEMTFQGDFPLLCVNGDVDVTGCLANDKGGDVDIREGASCGAGGSASITCYQCLGVSSFGTVVVPGLALLRTGSHWYYEVTLLTGGLMQIGWASSRFLDVNSITDSDSRCAKQSGDGCGDDSHSWGYCGNRGLLWHDGAVAMHYTSSSSSSPSQPLATWAVGDVLGCYLSVSNPSSEGVSENTRSISIRYTINGRPIAPADPSFCQATLELLPGEGLFPALSVEVDECIEVNLGTRPFLHLPAEEKDVSMFKPVKDGFESEEESESVGRGTSATADAGGGCANVAIPDDFRIELEEKRYRDADALVNAFTPQELAHELRKRGLKAGGTHHERAQRLHLVQGLKEEDIDPRLRMKPKRKQEER